MNRIDADELLKYKRLYDQGLLSQESLRNKKNQFMDYIPKSGKLLSRTEKVFIVLVFMVVICGFILMGAFEYQDKLESKTYTYYSVLGDYDEKYGTSVFLDPDDANVSEMISPFEEKSWLSYKAVEIEYIKLLDDMNKEVDDVKLTKQEFLFETEIEALKYAGDSEEEKSLKFLRDACNYGIEYCDYRLGFVGSDLSDKERNKKLSEVMANYDKSLKNFYLNRTKELTIDSDNKDIDRYLYIDFLY